MSQLTFILGGARSGKSRYAQELALQSSGGKPVLYLATGVRTDGEMSERIDRHQSDRPNHWRTAEEPLEAAAVFRRETEPPVVLLDCLTFFVTNHLLKDTDWTEAEPTWDEAGAEDAVDELIMAVQECAVPQIFIVSNEVGMGLHPDTPLGRVFRDVAGRGNQKMAAAADTVIFMVAGIPWKIKDAL